MVFLDRLGDVLQHHRLTDARRCHDQAALALTERRDDVDHTARAVFQRRVLDFHVQTLFRIQRRQVVEQDLGLDRFRVFEIDRVDLEQGEVTLTLARAAHGTVDSIARAQAETTDLRRGNIDIVRTRKIVGVRAAQEAEAVRQDFQHARSNDLDFFVGEGLQDGEQQVLLAQIAGVLDVQALGEGDQVFWCLLVQFLQGDAAIGDNRLAVIVFVSGRGIDAMILDLGLSFGLDLRGGFFNARGSFDSGPVTAKGQGAARTLRRRFGDFRRLIRVFGRISHGVLTRAPERRMTSDAVRLSISRPCGQKGGDGISRGQASKRRKKRGTTRSGRS